MALSILLALVWLSAPATADAGASGQPGLEAEIEALFTPGRDLADVKLAVDFIADPSTNIADGRSVLDELTQALSVMAQSARSDHDKLKVLRRFIYESGPWNGHRPFAYDMADPLGKKPENKLLGRYIRTRLGNCVTMPMLVMILGRRIGLKMTLALAPFHVLVKFTDEAGREWNLEATSGAGYTRDLWYRQELPMSDLAVAKGTYLRALSDEEVVGLMVSYLLERDLAAGNPERVIVTANVILRHFPKLTSAWIARGSAYYLILRRDIVAQYQYMRDMPPEIRAYADALSGQNVADFAQAEALGWTEQEGVKR